MAYTQTQELFGPSIHCLDDNLLNLCASTQLHGLAYGAESEGREETLSLLLKQRRRRLQNDSIPHDG